jgi:hypothetical protein
MIHKIHRLVSEREGKETVSIRIFDIQVAPVVPVRLWENYLQDAHIAPLYIFVSRCLIDL